MEATVSMQVSKASSLVQDHEAFDALAAALGRVLNISASYVEVIHGVIIGIRLNSCIRTGLTQHGKQAIGLHCFF